MKRHIQRRNLAAIIVNPRKRVNNGFVLDGIPDTFTYDTGMPTQRLRKHKGMFECGRDRARLRQISSCKGAAVWRCREIRDDRGIGGARGSELHVRIHMKHILLLLVASLASSLALFGQSSIPVGTILPLGLNSSLNSKRTKPGKIISARLMQDVSLPTGSKIRAGATAIGRVIDVSPADYASRGKVSFQFDALVVSKQRIRILTSLRGAGIHDGSQRHSNSESRFRWSQRGYRANRG
jgi:hypothetical protein